MTYTCKHCGIMAEAKDFETIIKLGKLCPEHHKEATKQSLRRLSPKEIKKLRK